MNNRTLGRQDGRLHRNRDHGLNYKQNSLFFLGRLVGLFQGMLERLQQKVQAFLPAQVGHPLKLARDFNARGDQIVPINATLHDTIQSINSGIQKHRILLHCGLFSRYKKWEANNGSPRSFVHCVRVTHRARRGPLCRLLGRQDTVSSRPCRRSRSHSSCDPGTSSRSVFHGTSRDTTTECCHTDV